MTVIMGINLSDRICLIADSRVSGKDPATGEYITKHDNMMKIEELKNVPGVMIASAGDARLAQLVIKELEKVFRGKGMVEVRNGIKGVLLKVGEEYGKLNRHAHANFLIAGVDTTAKKTINKARFNQIIFSEHVKEMGGGSVRNHLMDALKQTQEGDEVLTLPTEKTVLFSVSLDMNSGVDIKDSEWGDVLVSGPSKVSKEDVGDKEIAKLEFGGPGGDDFMGFVEHDGLLSVAIAITMTRKHDWLTVGGAYVPIQVYSNGSAVALPRRSFSYDPETQLTEEINAYAIENGRFYRVDTSGAKHRLTKVSELKYKQTEDSDQSELQI